MKRRDGRFTDWVTKVRGGKNKQQSLTIIFAEASMCYGYLITPSVMEGLLLPRVTPIKTERVDADWALARDVGLASLHNDVANEYCSWAVAHWDRQ